ncbi:TIGR01777 family protein [bacterium DOLJORAL78_65_58]|nr:MAG: TIGR01777 family protein [bacterium DOLJORAL78_65_58]
MAETWELILKVFITGGTGLVGRHLARRLLERGDEVTILTRSRGSAADKLPAAVDIVEGNPVVPGDWQALPRRHDAVVNLAGAPVFESWWTKGRKRVIRRSRLSTTFNVIESLEKVDHPITLVSASAVGYYGDGGSQALPETAQPGDGFLARLACEWEHTAGQAASDMVRVAMVRLGIVLAGEGGALPEMIKPFNWGIGGHLGNGRQYFPWIHIEDLVAAILFVLDDPQIEGPVNAVVPTPPTQKEFTQVLAGILDKPVRWSWGRRARRCWKASVLCPMS